MADAHEDDARDVAASPADGERSAGRDDEHARMREALDEIEADLDDVAATIARMG